MRRLCVVLVIALSSGCADNFRTPTRELHLPSGKVITIVSCMLAWGVDHDDRLPQQDAFQVEYLSSVPREQSQALEREVLEVFEMIRPLSEQWGLSSASVVALRTPERTGTYDAFGFTRSAAGTWAHTTQSITRNKE
jgi:hypothetical protein